MLAKAAEEQPDQNLIPLFGTKGQGAKNNWICD
jgi:hypothetical protein